VVEGDAGHEPAIEEALLGAGAFEGNYFGHYYTALIGRLFRACANSSTKPTPESLTCYINHLCIPAPGAE
jgi:hypothetical protein